jgi:hypothetical protein
LEFLHRPSDDDQPEKDFSFHFYFNPSETAACGHHRKCFVEARNKTESQKRVAIKPQISTQTKTIFQSLLMKKLQPTTNPTIEEQHQETDEEIQFSLQDTITGLVETEILRSFSSSSSLEQNALFQVCFRKTAKESEQKKEENNNKKKNESVLGKRRLSKAERKKLSKQRKVVGGVSDENKKREQSMEVEDDDDDDNNDCEDTVVTAAEQSYYDFTLLFAVECSPVIHSGSSRDSKQKVSITLQTDRLLVENYLNYFFRLSKK